MEDCWLGLLVLATASHASKGDCWRLDCWLRPRRTPRAKGDCWQPDCLVLPRGLPRAQDDCWLQPRVQFKFVFKGGSRLCRSWPSGRCRFCRSPLGFAAVGLRAAVGFAAPHGQWASRFRPSGRSWFAAPLGLSVCRCRLAAVGVRAAVGLPQSACRARKFIFEILHCLRYDVVCIIQQGQPRSQS